MRPLSPRTAFERTTVGEMEPPPPPQQPQEGDVVLHIPLTGTYDDDDDHDHDHEPPPRLVAHGFVAAGGRFARTTSFPATLVEPAELDDLYILSNSPVGSNYGSDNDDAVVYIDNPARSVLADASFALHEWPRTGADATEDDGPPPPLHEAFTHTAAEEDVPATTPSTVPMATTTTTTSSHRSKRTGPKKITPREAEHLMSKYYAPQVDASACANPHDLMVAFLHGLSALHHYSFDLVRTKHFVATAIALGTMVFLAVLAPFAEAWDPIAVSAGNAFAAALLLRMVYANGPVTAYRHRMLADYYAQTENIVGSLDHEAATSPAFVTQLENSMRDHLDRWATPATLVLPGPTVRLFPILHNMHLFRTIKKMDQFQAHLLVQFCDIKNEIAVIKDRWKTTRQERGASSSLSSSQQQQQRERHRLLYLMKYKEHVKYELLSHQRAYSQVCALLHEEIQYANSHRFFFAFGGWFKPAYATDNLVPAVREFLQLTLRD